MFHETAKDADGTEDSKGSTTVTADEVTATQDSDSLANRMLKMKLVHPSAVVADSAQDDTLFEIVPELVVKDKLGRIAVNDLVRLRHIVTGRWMHAEDRVKVERMPMAGIKSSKDAFENTTQKATWDKAPLIQVSLSETRLAPDAFQMIKVPDELTYWTATVSGYLSTLHRFAEIRKQRAYTCTEAALLVDELNELDAFLYIHGIEQKGRQKLLRSLQIVEALIAMLKAPFACCDGEDRVETFDDIELARHETTQNILRGVFKVLRSFLTGNSRKNEMYMCVHMGYLWGQFGTKLNVESMFNELVRDNITIVNMFGEPEVQKVIELLNIKLTGEDPTYLELLSVLSSCNGRPCQRHQKTIGRLLLSADEPPLYSFVWQSAPHAFRLDSAVAFVGGDDVGGKVVVEGFDGVGILRFFGVHVTKDAVRCGIEFEKPIGTTNGTNNGVEYFTCPEKHGTFAAPDKVRKYLASNTEASSSIMVSHPHHSDDKTISNFAQSALDEDDSTNTVDYLFLQQQLELFSALCLGRDEDNISLVTKLTPIDVCLAIAMATSRFTEPECSSPLQFHDAQRTDQGARLELPRSLRTRFVELMVNAFVDRDGMNDIAADILLSYDVHKLTPVRARSSPAYAQADAVDLATSSVAEILSRTTSSKATELCVKLKALNVKGWIAHELQRNAGRMIYSDQYAGMPHNMLLTSILKLLHSLIKYGFYNVTDARVLMGHDAPLRSILDGSIDRFAVPPKKDATENSKATRKMGLRQWSLGGSDPSVSGFESDVGCIEETAARVSWGPQDMVFEATGRYNHNANSRPVVKAKYQALMCVEAMQMVSFNIQLKFMLTDLVKAANNLEEGVHKQTSKTGGSGLGLAHRTKGITDALSGALSAVSNPWGLLFGDESDSNAESFSKVIGKIQAIMPKSGTEIFDKELFDKSKDIQAALRAVTRQFSWIHPGWDSTEPRERPSSNSDSPSRELVDVLADLANYQGPYGLLTKSLELIDQIYSRQGRLLNSAIHTSVACSPASCELVAHLDCTVPELRQLNRLLLCESKAISRMSCLLDSYADACYVKCSSTGTVQRIPNRMNQQYVFNRGLLAIVIDMLSVSDRDPLVLKSCFSLMRALANGFPAAQEAIMDNLDLLLEIGNVMGSGGARDHPVTSGDSWPNTMGLALAEVFTGHKGTCIRIHVMQVQRMLDLMVMFTHQAPSFVTALEAIAKVEEDDLPLARNQHIIMTNVIKHEMKLLADVHIDARQMKERIALLREATDGDRKLSYHLAMVGLLAASCEGENQQNESTCRSIFNVNAVLETITDAKIHESRKGPYFRFLLWAYLVVGPGSSGSAGLQELEQPKHTHKLFASLSHFGAYLRESTIGRSDIGDVSVLFQTFVPVLELILRSHTRDRENANAYADATAACNIASQVVAHVMSVYPALVTTHDVHRCAKLLQFITSKTSPVKDRSGKWAATLADLDELMHTNDLRQHSLADTVTNGQHSQDYHHECSLNAHLNELTHVVRKGHNGENTPRVQLAHLSHKATLYMDTVEKSYAEDESEDEYIPLGLEFQGLVSLLNASTTKYRQMNMADGNATVSLAEKDAFAESAARTPDLNRPTLIDNLPRLWSGASEHQASSSAEDRAESQMLIRKTLQVVRAMLRNDTLLCGNSLMLQNVAVDRGVVIPCASLVNSANRATRQEALALMKGFLANGCGAVQQAFAVYFLTTRDEQIFSDFSTLLATTQETKLEARMMSMAEKRKSRNVEAMKKERTLRISTKSGKSAGVNMAALRVDPSATVGDDGRSDSWSPMSKRPLPSLLEERTSIATASSSKRKNQIAPLWHPPQHETIQLSQPLAMHPVPPMQTVNGSNDTLESVRRVDAMKKLQGLLEDERLKSLKRTTEDPGNVRLV